MKKNHGLESKIIRALLMCFTAVFIISSQGLTALADEKGPSLSIGEYWGYIKYGEGMYKYPAYIFDGNEERVAYCMKANHAWPHPTENYFNYGWTSLYKKEKFTLNNNEVILKAIYNGYPYDSAGIQKELSLTNMQYRAVTQAVIWYYTDGYNMDAGRKHLTNRTNFAWTDNMTKAYNTIVNGSSILKEPSEDFELDIFTPTNDEPDIMPVQQLVSTRIASGETPPPAPVYEEEGSNQGQKPDEGNPPSVNPDENKDPEEDKDNPPAVNPDENKEPEEDKDNPPAVEPDDNKEPAGNDSSQASWPEGENGKDVDSEKAQNGHEDGAAFEESAFFETPETGDESLILWIGGASISLAACVIFSIVRRKNRGRKA